MRSFATDIQLCLTFPILYQACCHSTTTGAKRFLHPLAGARTARSLRAAQWPDKGERHAQGAILGRTDIDRPHPRSRPNRPGNIFCLEGGLSVHRGSPVSKTARPETFPL